MFAQPQQLNEAVRAEPEFRSIFSRFLPYLWPKESAGQRWRIVIAFILVLASKAVQLSMGFIYARAVNLMQPGMEEGVSLAVALVVAYAGARFSGVLFDNLRNTVFERVGQDATRHLAENVFSRLHALSLRFHLSRRTGEVTKIIDRGTKSIDVMLYFLLFNIGPTAIELAAVLIIFAVKFSIWLSLATGLMVIVYLGFTRRVTNWRNALRAKMNDLDTLAIGRSVDSLLNYETVKYFGAELREARRYNDATRSWADAAVKSENSLAWLNIGQSLITNLMMAGAMGFTVWGWSRGMFATGDVVLVNTLLAQLFRPLDMLGMVYRTIRQGLIDMDSMFRLIDLEPEIRDVEGAGDLHVDGAEVVFDNVSFGYDPERQILNSVSFRVPAGGSLAIVGPSGSGKSTIARLLFRFFDVQSGRILIDGQDISEVTQSSLRAAIGIVPQDTVLFNDSIGYNIAYGREHAEEWQVREAAIGAAVGDFIKTLPQGFGTQVGERGLKLKKKKKQRIAIARTLLKNAPVLILDEATSALDSRTEQEILGTLETLTANRTTITIAHRLSTIAGSDQILVIESGVVRECGTHEELIARAGLYAEMWARQAVEEAVDSA